MDVQSLFTLAMVGVFGYFVLFRPQRKQQKERSEMMSNLKKGDRVVTVGGIHGIIRGIREDRVTLEIASEVYVQFTRSAISSLLRSDPKGENAPDPEMQTIAEEPEDADEDAGYEIDQDQEQDQEQDQDD